MKLLINQLLNSFRSRLLLSFFCFVFVILAWMISYQYIDRQQTQLRYFSVQLTDIQTQYLESTGYLQKFMLSGYHEYSFYTSGKQKDIDSFLNHQNSIARDLESLKSNSTYLHLDVGHQIDSLMNLSHQTLSTGKLLKSIFLKRGFEDRGLEGDMRKYAHWIEDSSSVPKTGILQLRRHEKDYMLRGKMEYADLFFKQANELLGQLPVNTKTYNQLNSYKTYFAWYVTYAEQLGVEKDTGIAPLTQFYISQFDKEYAVTNELVNQKTHDLRIHFHDLLIIISVVLLMMVVAMSFILSKYLTRDIRELNKRMSAFINSDFRDMQESPESGIMPNSTEIKNLYNDFTLLKTTLREHISNLNKRSQQLQAQSDKLQEVNEEMQVQSEELQAQSEELRALNEELLSQRM